MPGQIPDIPEQQKQSRWGRTPFEPIRVTLPGQTISGITISEEAHHEIEPHLHHERLHLDRETVEAEWLFEANRKPTNWRPMTWTLSINQPTQVLGIRPGRATVMFFNGTNRIWFARDETSVRFSTVTNQPVGNEVCSLYPGSSLAVDVESEWWAAAQDGTTVEMIETWYDLDAIALARQKIKHNHIIQHEGKPLHTVA